MSGYPLACASSVPGRATPRGRRARRGAGGRRGARAPAAGGRREGVAPAGGRGGDVELDPDQLKVLAGAAGAALLLVLVLVIAVAGAGRRVTRASRDAAEEAHEREVLAARGDLADRTWSMVRTARRSLAEGRDLRDVYTDVDDLR